MNKIIIFLMLIILLLFSCNDNTQRIFYTWNSLGEMDYREPDVPLSLNNEILKQDFFPWAGIVSHHILAHDYIDAWFSNLAKMRSVDTFYILSPNHYNLSLEHYSLTTGAWDSGFGLVESNKKKVKRLAKLLEVDIDDRVFEIEHGASALMPYIKKHFPDTKVVPIIISGDSSVNTYIIGALAEVLEKEFEKKGKRNSFLIISSDFSHNGNINETSYNDSQSEKYLKDSINNSWNTVICDNRAGIYILDRLGKSKLLSHILLHTNSYEISGVDKDITSYFFVYFGENNH